MDLEVPHSVPHSSSNPNVEVARGTAKRGALVAFEGTVTIIGLRHLKARSADGGHAEPWLSSPPEIGKVGSFLDSK